MERTEKKVRPVGAGSGEGGCDERSLGRGRFKWLSYVHAHSAEQSYTAPPSPAQRSS